MASQLLNELMARVRQHAARVPALRRKLFQANFHTTLSGQSMVSLIYHRKLASGGRGAVGAAGAGRRGALPRRADWAVDHGGRGRDRRQAGARASRCAQRA